MAIGSESVVRNDETFPCLTRAQLEHTDLGGAALAHAKLEQADLMRADLRHADLTRATLSDANLLEAHLAYADLSGADLEHADLCDADLYQADLAGADLSYADLRGARLTGANLGDAKLDGCNLSNAMLDEIFRDFCKVLTCAPNEVVGLRSKLIAGEIDGRCRDVARRWDTARPCLIGTIAAIRGCHYEQLGDGLKPDPFRPAERWFLALRPGDKPSNSQIAEITERWIRAWMIAEAWKGSPQHVQTDPVLLEMANRSLALV